MFKLELQNKKSIYEQIIDGYKGMIISGELKPGDRLQSVRELSEQLTVNPNTVQKAYRALEQQGWIYSVTGRGNFVAEKEHKGDPVMLDDLYGKIAGLIEELLYLGAGKEEICDSIQGLVYRSTESERKESTDSSAGNTGGSAEERGGQND